MPRKNDLLVWSFSEHDKCNKGEMYSGLHTGETEGDSGLRYLSLWSSYNPSNMAYSNGWMPKDQEGDASVFMVPKEYMT